MNDSQKGWMSVNDIRRIEVTREPLTYEEGSTRSFFADLARAGLRGDERAKARLERHQVEIETRANRGITTTAGAGGEFAPPLWVIERFATPARAGRVLSDLVNKLELPPGVAQVNVPKETTGADATVQAAQNDSVVEVDQVTAVAKENTVVTIAGEIDASMQLLEQAPAPGYDAIAYLDLTRAYNANLEVQVLNGAGSTVGQLMGVQQLTGRISDVSGASVSATQATGVPQFWPLLGQAAAGVSNTRKLPVEVFLMAPRRWYWTAFLTVAIATAQQSPFPLLPTDDNGFVLPAGNAPIAGSVPVYLDGAIPAGTNTDVAIACRPSDMWLWESPPKFAVDQAVLSGTLQARLQLRRYAAFVNTRSSAVCVVTAIPAPTGY